MFPLFFRKRSCKYQGISSRYDDQNYHMKQVHFHGKTCIIRKRAERIDCRMNDDAREKASAAIKNRDQQETDGNRKDDLTQVIYRIHATSVKQINNMTDTECHA